MNKRLYNMRIKISNSTSNAIEDMFEYIKIFTAENENIVLELFFWYDNKDDTKQKILDIFKINNVTLHKNIFSNNRVLIDISDEDSDLHTKFNLYYNDSGSFINSLVNAFLIIKADYKKEVLRNENRNDRKQIISEKIKNKRSSMDDKAKKQ